jgi:hypothetical protein
VASLFARADKLFNWLEHGYLLVQIGVAVGVGKLVQAVLLSYTRLPGLYVSAIWWLSGAIVLATFVIVGQRWHSRGAKIVQATDSAGTVQQLEAIEQVYRTYDNQMLNDTESLFQASANKYRPGDERDGFLIRTLASIAILAFFESTWYSIFASQIKALERLNKEVLKMEDLLPYFQENIDKRPQYSFESWFGFLKQQVLLRQDGHNIMITIRGKEFLRYLVQYGRTWGDKPSL